MAQLVLSAVKPKSLTRANLHTLLSYYFEATLDYIVIMKFSALSVAILGVANAAPSGALKERAASVEGFDISSYQSSNYNFHGAYNSGARFVLIKARPQPGPITRDLFFIAIANNNTQATQNTNYISPTFSAQYTGATNAGFIRGAYHFAIPNGPSGAAQAEYFLAHGGGWSADGRTLPGMLDIEYNPSGPTCYGLSQSAMVSWIADFVNTYHSKTGRYPIIYSTANWWEQCTGNSAAFHTTCPLDLASYNSAIGTIPGGWPFQTFWQYNDHYAYGGDSMRFNGNFTQLKKLATG